MMRLFKIISEETPMFDKALVLSAVPLNWFASNIDYVFGSIVGVLTIAVMILRVCVGWQELSHKREANARARREAAEEDAERALKQSQRARRTTKKRQQ